MAGLAGHLEGDAIGSGVLELEGGGREVVEILVQELQRGQNERILELAIKTLAKGAGRAAVILGRASPRLGASW